MVQIDTLFVNVRPDKAIKHFTAYDPIAKWTTGHVATKATYDGRTVMTDESLTRARGRRWATAAGLLIAGGVTGGVLAGTLSANAATDTPTADGSSSSSSVNPTTHTRNGYPAHAQTLLDMRDLGFEDYTAEAAVPGLSSDVSDKMLALYQGKSTTQATLDDIAKLISEKSGS